MDNSKEIRDAFFVGLWLGHRLGQDLGEAYAQKFEAHPGDEMAKANAAIDEVVDNFKTEVEARIQTEYELNRDDVPALAQQDATDCVDAINEMIDNVVYEHSDEPLLPVMLGVLGR